MSPVRVEVRDNLTRKEAWKFASQRALIGLTGSVVALALLMGIMLMLPRVEAAFFPVVKDFQAEATEIPDDYMESRGGVTRNVIAFRIRFEKIRDCRPSGRAFYALQEDGHIFRLSIEQPDLDPATVGTGRPLGLNVGGRIVAILPPGTVSISGEQVYDCGWPWAALRQPIGPFDVASLRR